MNEELTREVLEGMKKCNHCCFACSAEEVCTKCDLKYIMQTLADALLEEMDKPKVWDGAQEDALQAQITWFTKNGGYIGMKTYTRELPKTRARIMAEEIAAAQISNKSDLIDIIEQTINTHMKELKGKE